MSLVIPLFIPHRGCPHQCSFCNQESITGCDETSFDAYLDSFIQTIEEWLTRARERRVEVAFYGGSFTCLPEEEQVKLLSLIQPYIAAKKVDGVRLSTRPDCVSEEVAIFLRDYGVKKVELGVQSMADNVLRASKRGHSSKDSALAIKILQQAGIAVGVQLMAGLPTETTCSFFRGVERIISLRPDFVRLYPVVVVKDSELKVQYEKGNYKPLTLNKAIGYSARFAERMKKAGIPVVRIGLQPSVDLEKMVVAGPYHPAFGELVQSRIWLGRIRDYFKTVPRTKKVELHISNRDLSSVIGMRKSNMKRLEVLGLKNRLFLLPSKEIKRGDYQFSLQ